jgi:hypothetical protein
VLVVVVVSRPGLGRSLSLSLSLSLSPSPSHSLSFSLGGVVARISAQNPRTERVDVLGHFPDFSIDIATSPVTSRECSRDAYEREPTQARLATGLMG